MKKPKEQTSPSYIDIVNWYWEHAIYFEGYKPEYAVLFFAIIDSVNKNYWRQTDIEYDRIINKTKLSKRAYLDARRWLMSHQIIDFVEGKNEFAKAKFSLGVAVQNCTSNVPPVHLQCSSSAPPAHLQCSSSAPSIKDNKDLIDLKDNKDLEDNPEELDLIFPFDTENFKSAWKNWLKYRSEKRKPLKSILEQQSALKKLSQFDEEFAIGLIETSMGNGWTGLIFEKTKDQYEQYKNSRTKIGKTIDEIIRMRYQ